MPRKEEPSLLPRGGHHCRVPERGQVPEANGARRSLESPGTVCPQRKSIARSRATICPAVHPTKLHSLCADPSPSPAPFRGGRAEKSLQGTGEGAEGPWRLGCHQGPARCRAKAGTPALTGARSGQVSSVGETCSGWREGAGGRELRPRQHGPHPSPPLRVTPEITEGSGSAVWSPWGRQNERREP